MSRTVFSCTLKSKDGGQTFYYVQPDAYVSFKKKLCLSSKSVQVDRIPNGPIVEALAEIASDSHTTRPYMKVHGKYMQYSGLKPRWIYADFRPAHVVSNFTTAKDLLLSKIIQNRSMSQSQCAMIIDRKLGGFYVDYNLYPLIVNHSPEIIPNFRWIEYVYFMMQIWLLGSQHNPSIDYSVLVNYSDQYGDLPVEIEYSIQFKAGSNDNKEVMFQLFQHLCMFARDQPINLKQFYMCAQDINDMTKDLERLKLMTLERLQLEDNLGSSRNTKQMLYNNNEKILSDINGNWADIANLVIFIGAKSSTSNSQNILPHMLKGANIYSQQNPKTSNASNKSESNKNQETRPYPPGRTRWVAPHEIPSDSDETENGQSDLSKSTSEISFHSASNVEKSDPTDGATDLGYQQQRDVSGRNKHINTPNNNNSKWYTSKSKTEQDNNRTKNKPRRSEKQNGLNSRYGTKNPTNSENGQNNKYTRNKSSSSEKQDEQTSWSDSKDPTDWEKEQDSRFNKNQPSSSEKHDQQTTWLISKDKSDWGKEDTQNMPSNFGEQIQQTSWSDPKNSTDWEKEQDNNYTKNQPSCSGKQDEPASWSSTKESVFTNCKDPSDWGNDNDEEIFKPTNENRLYESKSSFVVEDSIDTNIADSDSSLSVVSSKVSETRRKFKAERPSDGIRERREKDIAKNVIISGMQYEVFDDLVALVVNFFTEVLRVKVDVRRVVEIGPEGKRLLWVQLYSQRARDEVLTSSQNILTRMKSRINIREDIRFADRKARQANRFPET